MASGTKQKIFGYGEAVPWFRGVTHTNPQYLFDSVAGRFIVLCFFGSAARPQTSDVLAKILARRYLFDDSRVAFFGVSIDPADIVQGRITEIVPGIRYFQDFDGKISSAFGLLESANGAMALRTQFMLLDPTLRVMAVHPLTDVDGFLDQVAALPDPGRHAAVELVAPVLIVPRIFEPAFCKALIAAYEETGGVDSGFMVERDGKTIGSNDHSFKRRRDHNLEGTPLKDAARARISLRLVPEIKKAFQFDVTRIERYIVACYDAESGGFFRSHRDNTTSGTAHRRFAVSINLNTEDYEGGDLRFPEFGPRTYRAPTGGAVVFSCSLLHEARPVTKGRRYAFLPFLYDEAAAHVRAANQRSLEGEDRKTKGDIADDAPSTHAAQHVGAPVEASIAAGSASPNP